MKNRFVTRGCTNCGFQWTISLFEAKEKMTAPRKNWGMSVGTRKQRSREAEIYHTKAAINERIVANATCGNCGGVNTYVEGDLPAPSGWYESPSDSTQFQFWDGSNWTDAMSPKFTEEKAP